jgi:hypothetical protein
MRRATLRVGVGIESVELVEVDVVEAEAAQRLVTSTA